MMRGGATVALRAHTPPFVGSTPTPANGICDTHWRGAAMASTPRGPESRLRFRKPKGVVRLSPEFLGRLRATQGLSDGSKIMWRGWELRERR